MKYHYFVSFVRNREGEELFTNNGVELEKLIDSMEDILKIEKIIAIRLGGSIRVLNYQLLKTIEK